MKVFPIFYFPPISWFSAFIREEKVVLDQHANYRKQQFYNRTVIKGPNKVLPLSVPVVRSAEDTPVSEKEISYTEDWQKIHWKSLETSYRTSPYFEYYEPQLEPYFLNREKSLQAFNLDILATVCKQLGVDTDWELSSRWITPEECETDYRMVYQQRPKTIPSWFIQAPYTQVFPGFDPDLSILDLLFNLGPEARVYLLDNFQG